MGGMLNKDGYQKLIDGDIEALEKHMPEHSLEKKHIIEVLKWSVEKIYYQKSCKDPMVKQGLKHCNICSGSSCSSYR
jgi:hypothetical protein